MDDDPIVFSVRDHVSRIVAVVGAIVFALAVFGPSRLLH
jgi:hypothetical protein